MIGVRSIQTGQTFPLSSVKPLEGISGYREFCLSATRRLLDSVGRPRGLSPVSGQAMEPAGEVEGLPYARCAQTGSLFLARVADPQGWAGLLVETSRRRHAPDRTDGDLSQSRTDHVYAPKLDWIRETLTLQGIRNPRILEAVTPPSDLSPLLKECRSFAEVQTVSEMELAHPAPGESLGGCAEAIVMLESLDRVDDPAGLLRGAFHRMGPGGLLFVTALVASGFDLQVLGLRNRYLYPPDRTNCFSLDGLQRLLEAQGFRLLEVSTPGVLDVEIVQAHLQADPSLPLSGFERQMVGAHPETRSEFQSFLQREGLSSFARIVARKPPSRGMAKG